jgi:porphyrinogen peroxidase
MGVPQTGIFALGTLAHSYLELDLTPGAEATTAVAAVAALTEPRTTMGGVNLVSGVRPELWRAVSPDSTPPGVRSFEEAVVGPDGFSMPATQHDLVFWISGGSYDTVFDATIEVASALRAVTAIATETPGWTYHRDLDLTGFIDGTENPPLQVAPSEILVPPGTPGAGGSILLLQKWAHDAAAWSALPQSEQERVIGRSKADSAELSDRPASSHAARTDQDEFGRILRRNTPYGSVTEHGTMFVGFAAEQRTLERMLESMAGLTGVRDELTRYTTPLTGAYYFVPSVDDLQRFDVS